MSAGKRRGRDRLLSGWVTAFLLLGTALSASAQAPTRPPAPEARPADVATMDAIIAAVYDVISGPAGQGRDWDRMRSLFVPGARLIPTGRAPDGAVRSRVLTVEEYIELAGPQLEKNGFFEREIGRVAEQYGSIAHLMSAYESRNRAEDPKPFVRGVNSFQLLHDGSRWWIVTIFWQPETPETPIPERLLTRP
jgi:hypothetical protein